MVAYNERTDLEQLLKCDGYKSLLEAVERDESKDSSHKYRDTLEWVLERARHYAEKTGVDACELLDAWEKQRNYWYPNFYQEANQPEIKGDRVRVFESVDDLVTAIGKTGFRCPGCDGVSKSPYECDSGLTTAGKVCDWKSYGLFGTAGKGVWVFVKNDLTVEQIFLPVAWEEEVACAPENSER